MESLTGAVAPNRMGRVLTVNPIMGARANPTSPGKGMTVGAILWPAGLQTPSSRLAGSWPGYAPSTV